MEINYIEVDLEEAQITRMSYAMQLSLIEIL